MQSQHTSLTSSYARPTARPTQRCGPPASLSPPLIMEHIIEHVAARLNLDPVTVRELNFLKAPPSGACFTAWTRQHACHQLLHTAFLVPDLLAHHVCSDCLQQGQFVTAFLRPTWRQESLSAGVRYLSWLMTMSQVDSCLASTNAAVAKLAINCSSLFCMLGPLLAWHTCRYPACLQVLKVVLMSVPGQPGIILGFSFPFLSFPFLSFPFLSFLLS